MIYHNDSGIMYDDDGVRRSQHAEDLAAIRRTDNRIAAAICCAVIAGLAFVMYWTI